MIEFLIGVDGGGSGTRARLARFDHTGHPGQPATIAEGASGPSGLMHGIPGAWAAVDAAVAQAFDNAGLPAAPRAAIAIGLGLAGVHNKQWAAQFMAANPGYAVVALESDGHTTVLGAHDGQAGAIIALGTGSVGEVKLADGRHVEVGGWGFPAGDEASGAWIGLQAVNHLQQSFDGRLPANAFADDVAQACGAGAGKDAATREILQQWLAGATQTRYAQLARVVLQHASSNIDARAILREAGRQVQRMAAALDPTGALPIALCGGLAAPMRPYLPAEVLDRVVTARGDSAAGALRLILARLNN
ncbi:MAG: BadF/BadG/BcrA/BcrD ATPase family protein [Duganella sp.]